MRRKLSIVIAIAFIAITLCLSAPQLSHSSTVVTVQPGGTFVSITSFDFTVLGPSGANVSTWSSSLPSGYLDLTDFASAPQIVSAFRVSGSNFLSGQIGSFSDNVTLGNWTFGNAAAVSFIQGVDYVVSHVGTNYTVSAVPIPAAVWLLGSGVVGLVALKRRKRA
jgi:hypothetical protein